MSRARRAFERAAATYDSADALHREVGRRLVEHLDPIRIDPARVLDLGCGTGSQLEELARRFPRSELVGVDFSRSMLRRAAARAPWWKRAVGARTPRFACADLQALPLAASSAALAFSNLALQWCDATAVFTEAARVLEKDGLLLFSTLGPDTLRELRAAFGTAPFAGLVDMHDLGDALVAAGFGQPVMEMELLTLEYSTLEGLLADLHAVGALAAAASPSASLAARERRNAAARAYESLRREGVLPATYEVVYGHAWKTGARHAADGRQVIDFVRAPKP
ncbi:MAG TPA: malonyl-ACP O-methyltransferase BioC, partial [Usitatibacter sp.]|nr:malonyl-ACP O-methyltransferase BioC [Usitatibacter sp.]